MKRCPYCNAQNDDESKFCCECGKRIIKENTCVYCGATVNEGDIYCMKCGRNLNDGSCKYGNSDEESGIEYRKIIMSSLVGIVVGLVVLAIVGLGLKGCSDYSKKQAEKQAHEKQIAALKKMENEKAIAYKRAKEHLEAERIRQQKEKARQDSINKARDLSLEAPSKVTTNNTGYENALSERKLFDSDLKGKGKKELELMRNSIYAHYGYRFKREDLFNYFSQYFWYNPTTSDMSVIYNLMSEIEKYNVDFIKKYE